MIIKKVLNTSVVLAEENGREKVVLGKGIGFGKKVGMEIDPTTIEKSYEAINSPEAKQMMGLIHEIPEEYFEIANKIIEKAKTILSKDLNQMILFNLTDHIFFAIERYREGMIFSNKISYEIKTYYPNEYSIGLYA
ncbi:CAT RNA binding domain-containing protein, partial [Enterococcus cecorum]